MAFEFTSATLDEFVTARISNTRYDGTVKLWGNNYTLIATTVDADLTDVAFSGYAGQALTWVGLTQSSTRVFDTSQVVSFESNGGGTPDDAYGLWLDSGVTANALWGDNLSGAPVTIDGVDDDLNFRFFFDFYQNGDETSSEFIVNQEMLKDINDDWFESAVSAGRLRVHLYKSDTTPSDSDTVGTYTEADFDGYGSQQMLVTGAASAINAGRAERTSDVMSWTRTVTGAAQTIYGYYLTNNSGTEFYGAQRFSSSVTLTNLGDEITFELVGSTGSIN